MSSGKRRPGSGSSSSKNKKQKKNPTQKTITTSFERYDNISPAMEVGRIVDFPGQFFSGGRNIRNMMFDCKILAHSNDHEFKDSREPGFQFRDLSDTYDDSWITQDTYQKFRHLHWKQNPDLRTDYLKQVLAEQARIADELIPEVHDENDAGGKSIYQKWRWFRLGLASFLE